MKRQSRCFFLFACVFGSAAILVGHSTSLANLILDFRAINGIGSGVSVVDSKHVTVTSASTGGSVTFEVWATVNGSNGNNTDESLLIASFGATSYNIGAGKVRGLSNLVGMSTFTFASSGLDNGSLGEVGQTLAGTSSQPNLLAPYKYDNDADADVGGTGPTISGWSVIATDANGLKVGNSQGTTLNAFTQGFEAKLGTITYAWDSYSVGAGKTELNAILRTAGYTWGQDGIQGSTGATTGTPTNPNAIVDRGTPIVIQEAPEPSTFVLGGLGLIGLAVLRHKQRAAARQPQ